MGRGAGELLFLGTKVLASLGASPSMGSGKKKKKAMVDGKMKEALRKEI